MKDQNTNTAIAEERNISDSVLQRVNRISELGEMRLPKDYNAANAIKSAWLILQETVDKENKPVLQSCSRESIANTLFNMVLMGLSPMKRQCSFVAYGGKLTLQREYNGTIALAKRFGGVKDVQANVIYKDDVFEYSIDPETGKKKVIKHEQSFQNIDDAKIVGAYAIIINEDGSTEAEIMSLPQIKLSWNQGYAKGNSPAHRNFPGEMCKKTVIGRACKIKINSSSDAILEDDDDTPDLVKESSERKIKENANAIEVNYEEAKLEDEKPAIEKSGAVQKSNHKDEPALTPDF